MRFALSPLPWIAGPDGRLDGRLAPERSALLAQIAASGFTATPADIEPGADPESYLSELARAGLSVAPGYVGFDLSDEAAYDDIVRLASTAAETHAALGLTETFVADYHNEIRVARPAVGAQPDAARDAVIARALRGVAEQFLSRGITPALHQHVGTWIETRDELLSAIDAVDGLRIGADVGHLLWAGIEPVSFVRENAERIAALHVKDIHAANISPDSGDYFETIRDGIVAEPGRGDIDLPEIVETFADRPEIWSIVEVDQPDGVEPVVAAARCYEWVQSLGAEGTRA